MSNSSSDNFFLKECVKQSKRKLTPREVILSLLRVKNWTQSQLAARIGMTRQALNNYLRGYWDFPTRTKIKIAQELGVDSSVIWDLESNALSKISICESQVANPGFDDQDNESEGQEL